MAIGRYRSEVVARLSSSFTIYRHQRQQSKNLAINDHVTLSTSANASFRTFFGRAPAAS